MVSYPVSVGSLRWSGFLLLFSLMIFLSAALLVGFATPADFRIDTIRANPDRTDPIFWMHQLDERSDLLLNPDRLMSEVQKAIKAYS